ncbi:MAG: HAD family hydrolase [Pseudomonadota bacterium]
MPETTRIAMWSGPRNISTAMMRSWDSRADTEVMDEPFYAAYLATTGLDHPMRDAVIAGQPTDWQTVAETCATCTGTPVIFQKHMSQHMVAEAPMDWVKDVRHAFLIRPPHEVAASFHQKWAEMGPEDLGFHRQAELFTEIADLTGARPPVVLASDVLADPGSMLASLCAQLGVAYDPAMLAWAPGPRASDGVWAAHWYNAVEKSTGFAVPSPKPKADLPRELDAIASACVPAFDTMMRHRLAA